MSTEMAATAPDTEFPSARDIMTLGSALEVGNPAAAPKQHPLSPPFGFGVQQVGTQGKLEGKKVLVYGAGDVWYKFILAPLLHLGVKPEDITIIENTKHAADLAWQHEGMNFLTRKELGKTLAEQKKNLGRLKDKNFDFAIIATPPKAHLECIQEAFDLGLPVVVEKPAFVSSAEYNAFEELCRKENGKAVFIDWQRAQSTLLYAALGYEVPFADSIEWNKRAEFKKLAKDKIAKVTANFIEGRGNPLAAIAHRGHLTTHADLKEGSWCSAGMFADMGIHPVNAVMACGAKLKHITKAFFGNNPDEQGFFQKLTRTRNEANTPESFASVDAIMSWNGQDNIPVHMECGKGPYPCVNDSQTVFEYESGKRLVHEFGYRTNRVTLYAADGTVLATAKERGEPYEKMFLEAQYLFDHAPAGPLMAYGPESLRALQLVEEAHEYACDHPDKAPNTMWQSALEGQDLKADAREKTFTVKNYKILSPKEEVIKDSCQGHSTAEGAIFDQTSGNFWYVDIEHGLLVRYNPDGGERKTWKLTRHELDKDGRPKQMLSVAAVNDDGSVLVMLSEGGSNAGLNYFNPETNQLVHIGKIPEWEHEHPENRPNDATIIKIGGRNHLLYGTMSRHWDKRFNLDSTYERTGAYYLLDLETLESKKIRFDGEVSTPLITNGLADGGDIMTDKGMQKILFWSETVENPGGKGEDLNVYRGIFDPKECVVTDIKIFKNHRELGGLMNGVETFGRPDGAQRGQYFDKEVYGISMLELGQLRFYYSNPEDTGYYGQEALRIQLPKGMTRCTRFALGHDGEGKQIGIVTSQDSGHFSRRWNADGHAKTPDGLNGTVIAFDLPEGLTAHPHSIERLDYPHLKRAQELADPAPTVVTPDQDAQVRKIKSYRYAVAA